MTPITPGVERVIRSMTSAPTHTTSGAAGRARVGSSSPVRDGASPVVSHCANRRPDLPPGRFVSLPGRGRAFVREVPARNDAPVVMLLHGWTATAALNWHSCFAPLGEHFRVIAADHRGHGQGL